MVDPELLNLAPAQVLILEQPLNRVELPRPTAPEIEAPAMWQPADRPEVIERVPIANQDQREPEMERLPLANEDEKTVAAVMGIWLGIQALEISRPDPVQKEQPVRRTDDEEEESPR